jgi:hypothetical protein
LGIARYSGTTTGTKYTVPSGRYAKVHLQRFSRGSDDNSNDFASISIGSGSLIYTGTTSQESSLLATQDSEIIIVAGQTVVVSSNDPTVNYSFVVREFSAT